MEIWFVCIFLVAWWEGLGTRLFKFHLAVLEGASKHRSTLVSLQCRLKEPIAQRNIPLRHALSGTVQCTAHLPSKPSQHMQNNILMYKVSLLRHLTIFCIPIWRIFSWQTEIMLLNQKCLSHHSVLVFSHSCGMSHHTNTLPKNYKSMIWLSTHCTHSCGICLWDSLHKNFATTLSWSRDTVWEDEITVKWIAMSTGKYSVN